MSAHQLSQDTAVFSRYNITDQNGVRDALLKVGQYAKIQAREARYGDAKTVISSNFSSMGD